MPAYMQIYEHFRKDIEAGAYPPGHKLPSKRMLAEEIGMSVVTVQHAYSLLCDEGYIEPRQRSGYIVIYKESDFFHHPAGSRTGSLKTTAERETDFHDYPAAKKEEHSDIRAQKKGEAGPGQIPAGTQNIFPFSTFSKTMRRVILDYSERIFSKPENKGAIELRQAISRYVERALGIKAGPEQIIIGAGAEYLYGLIAQLFKKEKIIALEAPSYAKIRQVYQAHGIYCEPLNLGSRGIPTAELQRSKARILHITPFNSYPSYVTADASKRREYLKWASERGGILIEDNYQSELTVSKKNEETIFSLSETGNVIYLNTFSRTIVPSLRVGYMLLPQNMLEAFNEKLGFYSCTVSVFEQYVLSELIESGEFERHINRIRRQRRKELASGNIK